MKNRYFLELFVLFVGMSIVAFFLIFFKYNTSAQVAVSFLGCIYYIVWGIMHHALRDRLSRLIILEYILVGCLVFLLLLSAFLV